MLKIKRMYEDASADDGYRILVDRLWARGVSKEEAKLDYWAKEIAPSKELRSEFHHEQETFEDFQKDYLAELNKNDLAKEFAALVKEKLKEGNVTLLYSAKNEALNNAVVLKNWLEKEV